MQTSLEKPTRRDGKRRFIFEALDLRGEIIQLSSVLEEINQIHAYPRPVACLLAEFVSAAVLLTSTMKFKGTLTLQARSDAQVKLIMAECDSALNVRAIAHGAEQAVAESFNGLLGEGQLAITVTPERGERYQGIVPLAAESLAASLDAYFAQSEQLQSRFFLASDGDQAAGLLLQQLPQQLEKDEQDREESWSRIHLLAGTLSSQELLELDETKILHRLYHEEQIRLFETQEVRFRCSCSQDRTLAALATLGEEEIRSILHEQGAVTMDCEFCNQQYRFHESDLRGLLEPLEDAPLH